MAEALLFIYSHNEELPILPNRMVKETETIVTIKRNTLKKRNEQRFNCEVVAKIKTIDKLYKQI